MMVDFKLYTGKSSPEVRLVEVIRKFGGAVCAYTESATALSDYYE